MSRIPGVWPAELQNSTKYVASDQHPAGAEQYADEPLRTKAADQRRHERGHPHDRHEEDDRQGRVRRERDRSCGDSRRSASDSLSPSAGRRARPGRRDALPTRGRPRRLPRRARWSGERPHPEARGSRRHGRARAPRLVARKDSVRELDGPRARESGGHEALQLAARRELGGDALEDAVADERACDLLRQRAGERPVDDPRDLGRGEDLVDRLLERTSPRPRRGPRWEERGASCGVGEPGALAIVLRVHG